MPLEAVTLRAIGNRLGRVHHEQALRSRGVLLRIRALGLGDDFSNLLLLWLSVEKILQCHGKKDILPAQERKQPAPIDDQQEKQQH